MLEHFRPDCCRGENWTLRCSLNNPGSNHVAAMMTSRPVQFGLSTVLYLVAFAAFNFWLFSLGAWGVIVAVVIDKHVLVAYLCMRAQVDRQAPPVLSTEQST